MGTSTEAGRRALILVDVQPTFCEGGALPTDGADSICERIGRYTAEHGDEYELVVTTQDWHIDPGGHFSETPDFVDTWPPHGIAGTAEAELHPALAGMTFDASVKKGMYAAAYSGFEGTDADGRTLAQILDAAGVTDVDVVGLVESHCVKETALDANKLGLRTRVLTDLTIPVSPELGARAQEQMADSGIELAMSGQD